MEDLVKYLLKYAFDHGISCALIRREQTYQSVALPDKKLIVINQNSKNKFELPFIIGHEIGHIMNGNVNGAFYCGKSINSEERLADLYSLNLIYGYASNQFDTFEEPIQFIYEYGIPIRMLNDTIELYKKKSNLYF
ncbi:hypothetical protein [Lactobacillus melliventris]|uniref:Putative prophage repressor n=1 Tax=Lactobacillus melliventris TaxID=1218507 RepID=A0A0F4LEF2_9LACO|nr:hypothetical protein [Lactobacillus melliventris]KJY56708.1 putative prophage repressor [Lactobacillus melliventris]